MKMFVLALSALLLVGCSGRFDKTELIGNYVLNVGPGEDVIELKDDGTYVHTFQGKDTKKEMGAGTWELEDSEGGQTVLNNFQPLPGEQTRGRGFYFLRNKRFFGKIRLMTYVDLNEYYEKQ
ncbi:MAG TPA: hypothetical protein VNW23_03810 [Opitutaceae bacterium]|jgi:hypothetical protein|nr:hypothetical protein [Opitutaceae bacterium]